MIAVHILTNFSFLLVRTLLPQNVHRHGWHCVPYPTLPYPYQSVRSGSAGGRRACVGRRAAGRACPGLPVLHQQRTQMALHPQGTTLAAPSANAGLAKLSCLSNREKLT